MIAPASIPRRAFTTRSWPIFGAAAALGLAAGGLSPLYGAALVGGLAVGLAALAAPVLGLAALTVAIPFSPAEGASRIPVAPSDLLVGLVLAAAALALLTRRVRSLRLTGSFWPGVAFLAVLVLSASFAPDWATSAKELLRWLAVIGALVVAATFCQHWPERRLVLGTLFVAMSAEALLGWAQFFLRRGPPSFRIGPFLRAYGTFGQPNPFAGYLALVLPLCFCWVLVERPWARRPTWLGMLAVIASGTGGAALLMSLSRGALVGLAAGVALLFCLYARRGGLLIAVVVAVVVIGFGLQATNLLPGVVGSRLAQIVEYVGWYDVSEIVPNAQNWAVIERMAHWQAAWNMYETHALLGVGPGHYALAYPDYRVNDFWKDPLGHAHNLYLNLMAEDGFFGILAYAILWLSWLVVIWRSYRRGVDPRDRALAAGALAGFIAVAIHGFFDNLTVHGLGTQMGILIGLAASTTGPADASGESS